MRSIAALCLTSAVLLAQDGQSPTVRTVDLVHHGDVIDVDVVGGFEFDWRGRLTPDGDLDGFAAIDEPVNALCRTEAEIAADVAKGLSKILRSPNVVVKIVDRSGRAQTRLEGAVRTPMRFSLLRAVHLRELLVIAGGLTDAASGDISVLRQPRLGCDRESLKDGKDNGLRTINIKISELLSGKTGSDPAILSGDIIRVGRALPIYVIGAVAKPGPLFVRSGMNLSQAIAAAGGLAKNAAGQQVKLFRREGRETRIIEADLARIKVDASKDPVLAHFDIIEVATRGGSPRKYPPVIAMPEAGDQGKVEPRLRIID